MAEEVVNVLRVETDGAIKSVKDLRNAISDARDSLVAMSESMGESAQESEEYQKEVEKLQGYQKTLNEVMAVSKKTNTAVAGSYNDLNAQLIEARKQWKNLTAEQREADSRMGDDGLLGRIQSLDRQLKNMDASIGQHQRNVGDYAGQIASISGLFGSAGREASSAISGVVGLTAGLKAMSKTPVIAILGVLVTLVQKVADAFSSSEETLNGLTSAFAPFRTVGDGVTKMLQGLGGWIAKVAQGMTRLADRLGLVNDEMRERSRLAQAEIEITKRQREAVVADAEARREASELNAKSVDKEKYTAQERAEYLERALELEEEQAQRAYENAKLEYETKKATNALTESSKEDLDEEAELYAKMLDAETNYYNKSREMTTRLIEIRNQEMTERSARLTTEKSYIEQQVSLEVEGSEKQYKLRLEARRKQLEIDELAKRSSIKNKEELNKALMLLQQTYEKDVEKMAREHEETLANIRVQGLKNIMNGYDEGSREYLSAQVEVAKEELANVKKQEGETEEAYQARWLVAEKALRKAEQTLKQSGIDREAQVLTNKVSRAVSGSIEEASAQVDLARYQLTSIYRQIGESAEDYNARILAARKNLQNALENMYSVEIENERQRRENEMNELTEGSTEYLEKSIELKKYELDTLHQLEGESNEAFRARQLAAEKAYVQSKQALLEKQVSMLSTYASGASSIMESVADIIEETNGEDERAVLGAKNLRIASAIIDTLAGAVTAYTTAQSLGPVAGPVVGSLNASAVIAAGMAQVAKLRSTQVSTTATNSGVSAGSVSVSSPTPSVSIPQTAVVTGASDIDRLNESLKDQRVYILSSDLTKNAKKVEIRNRESSF